jgi:ribonuclease D
MHILTHDIDAINEHLNRTKSPYIAMDTEFVRQKTFYPELALIQMAFEGECYIIDALAQTWNPRIVRDIIFQDFLTLVFHSCRQDMEIFFHLYKDLPKHVFDTQIAALFIGLSNSLSYEALVKHYLQLDIDKSQQHTDWLKRPLDYAQVEYAAKDVIYLADIYPQMVQDLKKHNRLEWALDEMRSLSRPSLFSVITPARLTRMGIPRKHYGLAKALIIMQVL